MKGVTNIVSAVGELTQCMIESGITRDFLYTRYNGNILAFGIELGD